MTFLRRGQPARFVHLLVLDQEGQPKPHLRCGDDYEVGRLVTTKLIEVTCRRCLRKAHNELTTHFIRRPE